MGVHPEFRRRGLGQLLMQWGHYRVDLLGYETFIESGPLGRWLFEGLWAVTDDTWKWPAFLHS